jgi:RecB family endonuclease NucS
MELDSKNLARLRRVANPRDVWMSESGDFTPWLAENIDVLADELGMTLTVTGTEVPVGEFRLDIKAEDGNGGVVVIENQLERTDHSHLGQCLTYASGLDAATVV